MIAAIDAPYKWLRLSTLAMTCCWSIIAASVGLNAFMKAKQDQKRVQAAIPAKARIIIDTRDISDTGAVLTVVSLLIFLLSLFFLAHHAVLSFRKDYTLPLAKTTDDNNDALLPSEISVYPDSRVLTIQSIALIITSIWFLATLIPFTLFFATRSANVSAFVNGARIPNSVITSMERMFHASPVYREVQYLRLVAVLPWFTLLFTVFSAAILYLASLDVEYVRRAYQRNAEKRDSVTQSDAGVECEPAEA